MSPSTYDQQFTIQVTEQMIHFIDQLARRQQISRAEIVRLALREYMDTQEDALGSRSRMGRRVFARLEELEARLVDQQARSSTLLLAALILQQMKPGVQGFQVLERINQLVAYAGEEIREVLEAKQ